VETVTVFRDTARPGGVAVEIAGRLNALLGEKAYPNQVKGVWGKLVAGGGGAIHAFPPPPSELFIVIRRERKAAEGVLAGAHF
jgi:hypothetical protein